MVKISGISDKIFSSKPVRKVVEAASDNPALFASGTTFVLSAVVRPISIMAAPKTDKEDKKYAVIKSLTSAGVGVGLTYAVSKPIEKAVKNIDKAPDKFLKSETVKFFKGKENDILKSKKYLFSTQFIKNSAGFLTAYPKSTLVCAIMPFIANKINKESLKDKKISFSGKNNLSKGIAKILDSNFMKNLSKKFSDTNLIQNMAIATDIMLTASFVNRVNKNKNIPDENKKPLITNSIMSTGLSILSTIALNKALDKPTEKFIKYFTKLNKDIKNQQKCAQGIKTIKTVVVMGGLYYMLIPFVSTFLSGFTKQNKS